MDSTFGRGCDCCKKLCADKDSGEPSINSENNKTNLEDKLLKDNENTRHINNNDNIHNENNFTNNIGNNNNIENTPLIQNNNDTNKEDENEKKETLYFRKINKAAIGKENIKKCFNGSWYDACQNKVLLLQEVKGNGSDLLEVTGSNNDWEITDKEKVLGKANCNPNNNKWIIVKVIT